MKTYARKTVTQLAAIVLLGSAGSAAAEDAAPWDWETGFQDYDPEHTTFPLYDGSISALMRINPAYVSVTTRSDAGDTNWHLVTIAFNCDGGAGFYRTLVPLERGQTVYTRCPNSVGNPRPYVVTDAYASVQDIDDATFIANPESFPTNDNEDFITVTDPNPEDIIPPRPSIPQEEPTEDEQP